MAFDTGYYKGELVSNGLFAHNNKTCQLISAQKISNSIDRPVLHALIWEAMLQSRDMHCSQFDFGSSAIGLQVSDLRRGFIFSCLLLRKVSCQIESNARPEALLIRFF